MIKYALKCALGHRFEGWFRNSADFDVQAAEGTLSCPVCETAEVAKDVMAPNIATSRRREAGRSEKMQAAAETLRDAARRARDYVEKTFEDVGKRFPEEARKIHYGETEDRPIRGVATKAEAVDLVEEGIEIAPVPSPDPDPDLEKRKLN